MKHSKRLGKLAESFKERKDLASFKKEISSLGYKVKTSSVSGGSLRALNVYDKNNKYVAGIDSNVYSKDTVAEHKRLFDLLNSNKGQVYDGDVKVIF